MNRTARVATIVATTLIGLTSSLPARRPKGRRRRRKGRTRPQPRRPPRARRPRCRPRPRPPPQPRRRPPAPRSTTISDYTYSSVPSVAPGTKVTVTNKDAEAHTVTADGPGGFDVKVDPGASATFTAPTTPGSYSFHCAFHANMKGTLKVG